MLRSVAGSNGRAMRPLAITFAARVSSFHTISAVYNKNLEFDVTPDELNRINQKDETVYYKTAGLNLTTRKLPPQFRKGVSPVYVGPYGKQISMAKKVSMGFGIIGVYVSKILYDIDFFLPEISYLTLAISTLPYPIIAYFTSPYVVAIHRVYDKTKAQTLENLVQDEQFVVSKLNYSGRKTVDNLVALDSVRLAKGKLGWVNWESKDPDNEIMRSYYVEDNCGGMKMDRIWGIVEKASGVNNGRSFFSP